MDGAVVEVYEEGLHGVHKQTDELGQTDGQVRGCKRTGLGMGRERGVCFVMSE